MLRPWRFQSKWTNISIPWYTQTFVSTFYTLKISIAANNGLDFTHWLTIVVLSTNIFHSSVYRGNIWNIVIWNVLKNDIKIWIHFRLSTPFTYLCWTNYSELSNFDNVPSLQSSHCCGLSIRVLWTMIIHARFLIKTCHHASHFYALNKHNYLCICLEIFLSKWKPLARVDPMINRLLTNWCESPCKKSILMWV